MPEVVHFGADVRFVEGDAIDEWQVQLVIGRREDDGLERERPGDRG